MEKQIEIEEGRTINFKASAFSPIMYNKLFKGRDFMLDMEALAESKKDVIDKKVADEVAAKSFTIDDYECFVRIAYCFAYQGLAPTPTTTQEQRDFINEYPDAWNWIDSFGIFDIYTVLPEIIDLWGVNNTAMAKSKKKPLKPPVK